MTRTAPFAGVLLLSALALQGCGGGDLGPAAKAVVASEAPATVSYPAAKYMPLAIGRWWKYHEVVYDQASALQPQGGLSQFLRAEAPLGYTTSVATERVLSREMLEGVWWYKMRRRWMGSGQDRITYWRHNSEGLLWSMDPGGFRSYQIRTPLQVGAGWAVTGGHRRILSLNGSLTVPYGQVDNCLVIEETSTANPNWKTKCWFAPSLGLVRELTIDGGSVFARYDLSKTGLIVP